MYRKCLRDGVIDNNIGKKGVLLARRDNSNFVRNIYEKVIHQIADDIPFQDILYFINTQIQELERGNKQYKDFIVNKSVGNYISNEIIRGDTNPEKGKLGDYTVPLLKETQEERNQQYLKKGIEFECVCKKISLSLENMCHHCKNYYYMCLPAQVQLAKKMTDRGKFVAPGTRLEYLVCNPENHMTKLYEKIEDVEYFLKHNDLVKIDYMYYLKALINPLDEVLDVAFKNEKNYKIGYISNQYNFRTKVVKKLIQEIKSLFSPKIVYR